MWTKNAERTLPPVLKRASEVLPNSAIDKRILIDDHSVDGTREIAERFGWEVYPDPHGGLASGFNSALAYVDNEFFISLEADLVIAYDWMNRIPKYMDDPTVHCASGIRYPDDPILRKIHEYALERSHYTMGSMDNTIWKTDLVKKYVLPVPKRLRYGAADSYIRLRLEKHGFHAVVDPKVVSVHLRRGGLHGELNRFYRYGLYAPRSKGEYIDETELKRAFKIAMLSPLRGSEIALKKHCPQIFYYYPLIRFAFLHGALKRGGEVY